MTGVGYDARDEILAVLSGRLRTPVLRTGTLPRQRARCETRLAGVGRRSGKHALLAISADQPKQREEACHGVDVRYRRARRFADYPDHRRQGALRNYANTKNFCALCSDPGIA